MTDLDQILLDQLHSANRSLKRNRRLRRLFPDPWIDLVIHSAEGRIKFFESMIQDKSLLKKRRRRTRKERDILYKHPMVLYYRNTYMMITLAFQMLSYHLSLWNKKER